MTVSSASGFANQLRERIADPAATMLLLDRKKLEILAALEAADELRLWEPGRKGYAAALKRMTDALAVLDSGKRT